MGLVSTRKVFAWGLDPILGDTMALIFSNCAMMNVEKFPKISHESKDMEPNKPAPPDKNSNYEVNNTPMYFCQCPAHVSPASKDSLV